MKHEKRGSKSPQKFSQVKSVLDNKMDDKFVVSKNEELSKVPNFVKLNAKRTASTFVQNPFDKRDTNFRLKRNLDSQSNSMEKFQMWGDNSPRKDSVLSTEENLFLPDN